MVSLLEEDVELDLLLHAISNNSVVINNILNLNVFFHNVTS